VGEGSGLLDPESALTSRTCSGEREDSAKAWLPEDNDGEVVPFELRVAVSAGAWLERESLTGERGEEGAAGCEMGREMLD
jgi:hypothetical protein